MKDFEPILEIIETKAKGRLDSPLHVVGYMLNPYYYYQEKELHKDATCMNAIMTCIEMFFPNNYDFRDLVAMSSWYNIKGWKGCLERNWL